ncbi:hypothetical protein GCM10020000_53210 [Streptomyces olivoverticillatus]
MRVEGGGARIGAHGAGRGLQVAYALDDLAQVFGRGAAAAADQGEAVFADEALVGIGQLGGG